MAENEESEVNKRRQQVNRLTDICEMGESTLSSKIASLGGMYDGLQHISNVDASMLGGLRPEDFFIYTHNYNKNGGSAEFVTNKITVADLEYLLYEFRLGALSVDIPNAIKLKDLAYTARDDLNLLHMSHLPHVVSTDLYSDVTKSPVRSIGLSAIDCDWDLMLKLRATIVSKELKLSALAYRDNFDYDPLRLKDLLHRDKRWPIDDIICDYGDLATRSYESLDLQPLSHRGSLDLTEDYGFGENKYIHGDLDFSHVSNYKPTIHGLVLEYLPLATTNNVGVVKLKRDEYSPNTRNYAVKMEDGLSTLYTTVPWVDTNTLSTFTLRSSGINTLVFEGYGINRSLDVKNNRYNDISSSEPIFTQEITLLPHIERNIILSPDVVVHQDQDHACCLARFSPKRNHLELEDGPSFRNGKTYESQYLSHNGTWVELPLASATLSGLMTKEDYVFLHNIKSMQSELDGNFYVLPAATSSALGGIKTGYTSVPSNGLYAVLLNEHKQAYVNVPNPVKQFLNDAQKIADDLFAEKLNAMYPVGSIYLTIGTKCPLEDLITGSEWTPIAKGRCLWGYDGSVSLGKTIDAALPALPAHTHTVSFGFNSSGGKGGLPYHGGEKQCAHSSNVFTTSSASYSSNIYGKSTTVQPPAYVVNIFLRTR